MRRTVGRILTSCGVASMVLQGAGQHFSVGGNPYYGSTGPSITPGGLVNSLRELYDGFLQLRTLPHPITCAVHGTLVGGGVAGCLHADHIVADHEGTFEVSFDNLEPSL